MLHQCPTTIPAEIRDYPEWRRGRDTYAVWILPVDNGLIQTKFKAAREHLSGYLLEPYRRQPHVTLFVCGFLVEKALYNDDFTPAQVQSQLQGLEEASIPPFEIEISGLNSFASAPFLEVSDPDGRIGHLRETLSRGAREFRTAPYTPHLTVGLYAGAFPSRELAERMMEFPPDPIKLKIEQIAFATYQAREITGCLTHRQEIFFTRVPPGI
jgi:2'-5' RNA ligase